MTPLSSVTTTATPMLSVIPLVMSESRKSLFSDNCNNTPPLSPPVSDDRPQRGQMSARTSLVRLGTCVLFPEVTGQ